MHRSKPLLIFDGDCGFCSRSVESWKAKTGDRIDYEPYQTVAKEFPQIAESEFAKAVHFVDQDGTITKGAEAVFRLMSYAPGKTWMYRAYRKVPLVAPMSELGYQVVAKNRQFFSKFF